MALVVKKESILPVTSLEYVLISGREYLLAGEGPNLKLFSKSGHLLHTKEVLSFRVVHGIRPLLLNGDESGLILVYGQKTFSILRITKQELEADTNLSFQKESEVVEVCDWILDVNWLSWTDGSNYEVVLITTHNSLLLYKLQGGMPSVSHYHSEVNCILYSACLIGSALDGLTVASGTVFNQILLWHVKGVTPGLHSNVLVRISFIGHQGVIFSVKLNDEQTKLVSASDDRTIRLWNIPPDWREKERVEECTCLLVLYGHTARVWAAMLLPNCIISIGEDATCRLWSYDDGQALTVFRGHKGKSIWSMAVDCHKKTVATGGGDCSIRLFSLEQSSRQAVTFSTSLPPPQYHRETTTCISPIPRCVFLLEKVALCLTDKGSVFAGWPSIETNSIAWSEVHRDSDFSGYSIGALSSSTTGSQVLALGNIHGAIKFLKLDKNGSVVGTVLVQGYNAKIFSLNWCLKNVLCDDGTQLLFSCGPNGGIICWRVKMEVEPFEVVQLGPSLTLPSSKHRWLTTVTTHLSRSSSHPIILCGDRRGSVHLYHLVPESSNPYQTRCGIHGPNGVTHFCIYGNFIYTCGRNGLCRKFMLGENDTLVELVRFKPVKGVDWIEKMVFTDDDMLVLVFHGKNLELHSTAQNTRILCISCGGGHRSCALSSLLEALAEQRIDLLFIKQAEVCFCRMRLDTHLSKSLIQQPFIGLEAESMTILHMESEGGVLLAVGGEDCSICLLRLCPSDGSLAGSSLEVIRTIQGHNSSVKALSSCSHSSGTLLLSGGSRASLKVWSIGQGLGFEVGYDAELFLHDPIIRGKKGRLKFGPRDPKVPPECRIMSLTSFSLSKVFPMSTKKEDQIHCCHYVAAGCSDAVIRQYIYDEQEKSFSSLHTLKTLDKCVLSVRHFFHPSSVTEIDERLCVRTHPLLCCSNTDGYVTIWNLTPFLLNWKQSHPSSSKDAFPPVFNSKVHQFGINSLAVESAENDLYAMATGGDDNALVLTYLHITTNDSNDVMILKVKEHVKATAHSSSITGVCFISLDLVMTTSIDQRLNTWRISREAGIWLVSSVTHDVADTTSLAAYKTRQGEVVAVFSGVGLQYYTYKLSQFYDNY